MRRWSSSGRCGPTPSTSRRGTGPTARPSRWRRWTCASAAARLVCMEVQSPDGPMQMWFTGEYREVVENERLVYTESMSDENGNVSRLGHGHARRASDDDRGPRRARGPWRPHQDGHDPRRDSARTRRARRDGPWPWTSSPPASRPPAADDATVASVCDTTLSGCAQPPRSRPRKRQGPRVACHSQAPRGLSYSWAAAHAAEKRKGRLSAHMSVFRVRVPEETVRRLFEIVRMPSLRPAGCVRGSWEPSSCGSTMARGSTC